MRIEKNKKIQDIFRCTKLSDGDLYGQPLIKSGQNASHLYLPREYAKSYQLILQIGFVRICKIRQQYVLVMRLQIFFWHHLSPSESATFFLQASLTLWFNSARDFYCYASLVAAYTLLHSQHAVLALLQKTLDAIQGSPPADYNFHLRYGFLSQRNSQSMVFQWWGEDSDYFTAFIYQVLH